MTSTISRRRNNIFSHIARLHEETDSYSDSTSTWRSLDHTVASGDVLLAVRLQVDGKDSAPADLCENAIGRIVTVERRYDYRWLRASDNGHIYCTPLLNATERERFFT